MTTHSTTTRQPIDRPARARASIGIVIVVVLLALLGLLAVVTDSIASTVGGLERGREVMRSGGTTADRIAQLDSLYGEAGQ